VLQVALEHVRLQSQHKEFMILCGRTEGAAKKSFL
jgi:hypothetical protein